MDKKDLFVIRGVPGSGKTFTGEILSNKLKAPLYSADMFFEKKDDDGKVTYHFNPKQLSFAHGWCKEKVESEMKVNTPAVFVANTFTREWEMKAYFDLAKKYGYTVHSLIVENRHGNENVHDVPAESLKAMRDRFEFSL